MTMEQFGVVPDDATEWLQGHIDRQIADGATTITAPAGHFYVTRTLTVRFPEGNEPVHFDASETHLHRDDQFEGDAAYYIENMADRTEGSTVSAGALYDERGNKTHVSPRSMRTRQS